VVGKKIRVLLLLPSAATALGEEEEGRLERGREGDREPGAFNGRNETERVSSGNGDLKDGDSVHCAALLCCAYTSPSLF
jgi:hypothetical protein